MFGCVNAGQKLKSSMYRSLPEVYQEVDSILQHRSKLACLQHKVSSVGIVVQVMQASFGGKVSSLFDRQLSPSVASPIDGCTSLQNQADVSGTVVIMARGNCYFSIKVPHLPALLEFSVKLQHAHPL